MSERILRPYTIIPAELYVHRSADSQLATVIGEMERPGYVLVARQMGKTNLLLNAKREIATPQDLFVYADVSNEFPELRGFFRHIIDIAAMSDDARLTDLLRMIQVNRSRTFAMPPHIEHEQELRVLLNSITGKLIICLDEVDALTKADFSDNVFSFVRSTYFSGRVNFPEFVRL